MIIETFEQYSPEYWHAKAGKPSSSNFSKIVSSTGKKSTQAKQYAFKLAAELETGMAEESFKSDWMDRGSEMESEARSAYEFLYDVDVEQVGVVYQDDKKLWLCSPDGLITEKKKGLEIKCPSAGVHKQYCYENKLPTTYKPQVYGSLWICNEIESWDFFSYHPNMRSFKITINRNDPEYKKYSEALEIYLPDFVDLVNEINTKSLP